VRQKMGFNIEDLKDSKFLTQNDVDPPVLATIAGTKKFDVSLDSEEPRIKWTLSFKELDKPLVLNTTNGQIIAAMVGSDESDDWIGRQIVLYKDPNVSFAGKLVGGIRCRAPKNLPAPASDQPSPAESKRMAEEFEAGMDESQVRGR